MDESPIIQRTHTHISFVPQECNHSFKVLGVTRLRGMGREDDGHNPLPMSIQFPHTHILRQLKFHRRYPKKMNRKYSQTRTISNVLYGLFRGKNSKLSCSVWFLPQSLQVSHLPEMYSDSVRNIKFQITQLTSPRWSREIQE